jgi:Tol biopolymer transport system component
MNKLFHLFAAFIVLTITILACSFSFSSGNPPPSQNEVATVVALTMQALTPIATGATATSEPANTLLPHSLYYLNKGSNGKFQIFRMEKDGKTVRQVTSETADLGFFAISPVDGRVAYVVNNQLIICNPDGSVRTVLVSGDPVDPNNPVVNAVNRPVWSPDGRTIAYAYHGLNFYSLDSGSSRLVIEDKFSEVSGLKVAAEIYAPNSYSPDGKKLLINIGFYESGTIAIYYPDTNTVVRLQADVSTPLPCCDATWTPDSAGLYSASPYVGMISSGLWHINASDGKLTVLIPTQSPDGTYNFADAPIVGADGQLYYFYSNLKDVPAGHTPLQLVRSGLDGVTGRTVLKDITFQMMNEALWSPDASFVVEAEAPVQDVFQGGVPAIIYIDGRPEIQLAEYAQLMKWGP